MKANSCLHVTSGYAKITKLNFEVSYILYKGGHEMSLYAEGIKALMGATSWHTWCGAQRHLQGTLHLSQFVRADQRELLLYIALLRSIP